MDNVNQGTNDKRHLERTACLPRCCGIVGAHGRESERFETQPVGAICTAFGVRVLSLPLTDTAPPMTLGFSEAAGGPSRSPTLSGTQAPTSGHLPFLSSRSAWEQERAVSIAQVRPLKGEEPRSLHSDESGTVAHVSLVGFSITFLSRNNSGLKSKQ